MRNTRIIHLLFLVVGLLVGSGGMRAEHYNFKQLTLQDGLPSTVRCIYAEKKGYVWIGTSNGLGRFDGHELKQFTHQHDTPNSLPDNYIHKITEDSLHNIWILTAKGIARYSRKEDNFHMPKDENGQNITAYSSCETAGGVIFGARNRIYRYDYATDAFSLLQQFETEVQFSINSISFWNRETLLCCNRWSGMLLLNIRTGETTPAPFDCGKEIKEMIIDSRNRVWVAPYNNGIQCFESNGKLIASYTTRNSQLTNDVVLCMTERDSHIWIGTDGGGINILDPKTREIRVLERIPGNNYSLPVNSILCLYNDAYDNIWAGSIRGGLINIKEASMKTYTDVTLGNNEGLSENAILSLYQDPSSDDIWIGTDGGGINKLNPQTEKFRHYPDMWGDKVASICGYRPGELLLSLFSKGLFVFNKQTGKLSPLHIPNENLNQLVRYTGRTINLYQYDPETVLLLADHLYFYHIASKQLELIKESDSIEINGTLLPISENGRSIYFHDLKTIYELDRSEKRLRKLLTCKGDTTFNSVSQEKGVFWIGGKYGLSSYHPGTKQHKFISTPQINEIYSILCDQRGKVWIGTDQMLFAWLVNEKKFIIFGESDGAIMNEYMQKPRIQSANGDIYLGGVKGLLRINRELPIETTEVPELRLTDVIINGESVSNQLSENSPSISVPWNSRAITIRIMSCEKDIFRQKIYRYHIPELNDHTIDSYSPELVIRSLSPGTYHILVSCSTQDGDWTPMQQILVITVLPPWYQTWWFILCCILFISAAIMQAFFVALRRKEHKLKWAMKEHEQQVYEEKVRFLINISHELRTPLTLIHAPLNRLLKSLSPADVNYPVLRGIYRQSQRMKDLLNMVLNVRKMEVGESKLNIQPHPLNEWIQEVANDFVIESEARNIRIRYELDSHIQSVGFDKEKCIIVLTNLLINALKHNTDHSEIVIRSEQDEAQQRVRVSIIDQGAGLKNVDIRKLFTRFYQGNGEQNGTGIGLSYSKILIELHGGSIGAYNNEDKGATFFFELPSQLQCMEMVCQPKAYLNELIATDPITPLPEAEYPDTKHCSLLLVDDNADLVEFLSEALSHDFKEVYTASDGAEALSIIGRKMPDMVVSDVMMPRMNGYELCKAVKEDITISHIPILLLTARDDEQSKLRGYKTGADDYLTKPFEVEMLHEMICNRLRSREQIRTRYQNSGLLPQPAESTFSAADETFLFRLNKIIGENLSNTQLDVPFICKEIGMSRATLYNKLKALTDISANEYINKLRLERAILLITTTQMTFTEIAEQTGFSTSRYFSTAFKQFTGETPTQYKESHRNGLRPSANEQESSESNKKLCP